MAFLTTFFETLLKTFLAALLKAFLATLLQTFYHLGFKDVVLHHDVVHVAVVGSALGIAHLQIAQPLFGFGQAWRCRVVFDVAILQIV